VSFPLRRFRAAVAEYEANWRATDDALYDLCRRYPSHKRPAHINAKLWIIGRTYATGIERKIPTKWTQGSSMSQLADFFYTRGKEIDEVIGNLKNITEPLAAPALKAILSIHGRLTLLVQQVTRPGQTPRSFVSKYLHFHNPAVPIIDGFAQRRLTQLVRWHAALWLFDLPPDADPRYSDYVFRFWNLYEAASRAGAKVTVKHLDYFLLNAK
jgi:hypothetical protein